MTDREKLVEIFAKYFTIGDSYEYSLTRVKEAFAVGTMTLDDFVEFDDDKVADIANFLIANGVTVKEPQKPLTVEELKRMDGCPVWCETEATRTPYVVKQIMIDKVDAIFYALGSEYPIFFNVDGYGKTWRCWAEKPTEEERKDAEWESKAERSIFRNHGRLCLEALHYWPLLGFCAFSLYLGNRVDDCIWQPCLSASVVCEHCRCGVCNGCGRMKDEKA